MGSMSSTCCVATRGCRVCRSSSSPGYPSAPRPRAGRPACTRSSRSRSMSTISSRALSASWRRTRARSPPRIAGVPRAQPSRTQRKRSAPAITRAFLFSDLRDYTSFVEAKGDAAAARLLRDYRTLVRRELARHDGAEVKTEGDSFYVVFEAPSAALDCAVAILRAADVRNGRDPTSPLRIGIGLHAGETVAYDDQFVGSAVNIASRIAGKAGAGELLISDTLRGLVRTSRNIAMSDRGALDLKGVTEPIRAWTVDWRQQIGRAHV